MKHFDKLFAVMVLIFSSHFLIAQTTIDPNPVTISELDIFQFDIVGYSLVTNESTSTKNYVWTRNIVHIAEGWECAVCDKNLCHGYGVGTANFTMAAAEAGTLDVHIYPFQNPGYAVVEVTVAEVGNPSNSDTGTYYFNTATSVSERMTNAIALYPNPASNLLFLESANKVHKLDFFGMDGKLIDSKLIAGNNSVEIGNLAPGTYVVRMQDNNGVQVSSNIVIKH
jgi:hypothetical protein